MCEHIGTISLFLKQRHLIGSIKISSCNCFLQINSIDICYPTCGPPPQKKGGIQSILVLTDHFARYSIAVPTKHQTAKTTAEANFWVQICAVTYSRNNVPYLKFLKFKRTPYLPMGNSITDWINRTSLLMIWSLDNANQKNNNAKNLIGERISTHWSMLITLLDRIQLGSRHSFLWLEKNHFCQ